MLDIDNYNPEYDVARESSNDYATALSKTNPNRSEINIIIFLSKMIN